MKQEELSPGPHECWVRTLSTELQSQVVNVLTTLQLLTQRRALGEAIKMTLNEHSLGPEHMRSALHT